MSSNPALSAWTLDGTPLALPASGGLSNPETRKNARDLTAFTMDTIRSGQNRIARNIIAEARVLARPLELKEIGDAFQKTSAAFDLSRQERQAAAAAYMIKPGTNNEACKQCSDQIRSKGPCAECIADSGTFNGACTNCHYSGAGRRCSFVVDAIKQKEFEQHSAQKRRRNRGEHDRTELVVTQDDWREAETSTIEGIILAGQAELARRRAVARTPSKGSHKVIDLDDD